MLSLLRTPVALLALALSLSIPLTAQKSRNDNFDAIAKSAAAAREAGNTAEAIRDYQQAVEIRADWEEGWWYLGTLEYDADHFSDAIPALQKVVQLDPAFGPAWNFLGLCEFETHDYENSLAHLQKGQHLGIGDDPEIARVSAYHLALLLNRNGEFSKATSLFTSTFTENSPADVKAALGLSLLRVPLLPQEVDPSQDALVHAAGETASLLARGDSAKTLDSFRSLLNQYPNVPYLHYAYGVALASAGKHDEALVQQKEELKISPASALPRIEISSLEGGSRHLQAAPHLAESPSREPRIIERYALKAVPAPAEVAPAAAATSAKPSPANFDEEWRRSMLLYSAGNYSEAITALKACVAQQPNNGTAWAVMGLSEFEMKDYNNARIHLQRGQDLGLSGSAESIQLARYRLATLLIQHSEFDRATDLLVSQTAPGPRAQEVQFALGMALLRIPLLPEQVEASKKNLIQTAGELSALLQASKYDEAFPKFQSLLRQYPATPFLHYAYGTGLAALSQYDEAETQLRQEISISPKSELPYLRLASIALKTHRPADALPSAQRAVELADDSPEAHYLLGRSWLELGQQEKALQELERASKMAPGSPEVHFNLAKAYAKANEPEKAEQERSTFARLNALAEQQRSQHGNQSYSGSHDPRDFSVPRAEPTTAPTPEAH
jgi:tetratricopeptide (TPR) repeat protein